MTTYKNDVDALMAKTNEPTKDDVIAAVSYASLSLVGSAVCITKFARAARRGQYDKATFYAVLWAGWTNNSSRAFNARFGRKFT